MGRDMIPPMTALPLRSARVLSLSLLMAAAILAACHKSEKPPEGATPAASPAGTASPAAAPATPRAPTPPLKVVALGIGKSVGADPKVPPEPDPFPPTAPLYAPLGP